MPKTSTRPRLSYRVDGSSGSPVLMIMGFGMRGSVWSPQIGPLSEQHQVITFDNRGIGESESQRRLWTMRDFADDTRRVLDAAGFERAHLVGVSMGGMIAQHTALAFPDRFLSLSLIATQPGGLRNAIPTPRGLRTFLKLQRVPEAERLKVAARLLYPREFLETVDRERFDQRMRNSVGLRAKPTTLVRQLGAVIAHDARKRLREIKLPTLIVQPGQDILVRPKNSERIHKEIRHAEVLRLGDAGHGAVFQSADQINAKLLSHFAGAEEKRPAPTTH